MLKKKARSEEIGTFIGQGCHVKGDIDCQHSLRIEGFFTGNLQVAGELYIGANSHVKADIQAGNICIEGEVIGNITAKKSVHILSTGKVYGDMKGDQLRLDEGGIFKGKVDMDILSTHNPYEGQHQVKLKS